MKLSSLCRPFRCRARRRRPRRGGRRHSRGLVRPKAATFNSACTRASPAPRPMPASSARYDAEHLARHPKQKVAAMKLLVSAEFDKEDKGLHRSFRLGFGTATAAAIFESSGSCNRALFTRMATTCASAAASTAMAAASALRSPRTTGRRSCGSNRSGSGRTTSRIPIAEDSLVAGAGAKIFRVDRADNGECASLVTDRKELAALRHK